MVEPLLDYFSPRMQPRDLPTLRRRQADVVHLLPASELRRHALAKVIEPLAGYGRNWHHVLASTRYLTQAPAYLLG